MTPTADAKWWQWSGWYKRFSTFNVHCLPYTTSYGTVHILSAQRLTGRLIFSLFIVFSCVGPTFETLQIPITWLIWVKKVISLSITEIWITDCRFYSRAARADARVNKRAINLAALALLDHEQLSYWPSTVAAALVILASVEDASCKRVMQVIKPVLKQLQLMHVTCLSTNVFWGLQ